jgi:hypothetical protein
MAQFVHGTHNSRARARAQPTLNNNPTPQTNTNTTTNNRPLNATQDVVSAESVLRGHRDAVVSLCALRDSDANDESEHAPPRRVVSASGDATVRVWRLTGGGAAGVGGAAGGGGGQESAPTMKRAKSSKKSASSWAFVKTK